MIPENVKDCVNERITPKFFDGVRDKRREMYPRFWRDAIFRGSDVNTDKPVMYWNELTDSAPQFVMPVVCKCDDYDYIENNSQYTQRSANFPYAQLANSINCDFQFNVGPDESCDGDRTLGEAIEDAYIEGNELVDESAINLEEMWAAQAAIFGEYEVHGGGIKPYKIQFPSCPTLTETLTGEYCWGKNKCNSPFDDMSMMDARMFKKGRGNRTTHIIMNQNTCDMMTASPFFKECLNSFSASVFLPGVVQSDLLSREMKREFMGGRIVYTANMPGTPNVTIWCVETFFDFVDPLTKKKVCTNLLPDGKVIGFDLSGGRASYGARFAYGGINNMHALPNMRRSQFARGWVPENGKSLKYSLETSPLALVYCPDARWCLNVCQP